MKQRYLWIIMVAIVASSTKIKAKPGEEGLEKPKVLIVGAGLAGLSMAKSLENIGISPTIVERKQVFLPEGAGIAIPANGAWALHKLGIKLEEVAHSITHMTFTTDRGDVLVRENVTALHPENEQFYAIDRTKLLNHLKDSLQSTQIKRGKTVKEIAQKGNGVSVVLSDGTKGIYDFVIVADGMHSQTRALLDPAYSVTHLNPTYGCDYLGIQIWRTIIPKQFEAEGPIYMLGSDKVFLLYPINDNQTYIYAHKVTERADRTPENKDHISTISELFRDFGGHVPKALAVINKVRPTVPLS